METTKNEMSEYEKHFFNKLSNYLDTKIYFYGSIQRSDYFPGSSDIDVDIFSDNMSTTISKLQHFFAVKHNEFKKVVYKLRTSNKIVHGYKFKYNDPLNKLNTEFSIYDEKYKDVILMEHGSRLTMPFYTSWILIILKYFFYNLGILPKEYFIYLKNLAIDSIDGKNAIFIVIEIPKDKTKN
jgi:predicted nucleotidyltransferase